MGYLIAFMVAVGAVAVNVFFIAQPGTHPANVASAVFCGFFALFNLAMAASK